MDIELISNIIEASKYLWKLVSSSKANNFGIFIGGIGTVILTICALISLNLFKTWQKQKQFEKKSDIAQEALNGFDLFKNHFGEWMQFANSCHIFNRESQNNSQKFESLNEDDQKIFLEKCDKNPYELNNYLKKGNSILNELPLVSSKAARLQNRSIVEQLEKLHRKFKMILESVAAKHFPCADSVMRENAIKDITESGERINVLNKSIHSSLVNFLMFNK